MPISSSISEHRIGSIVAVEGNAELVATQLRLLPPSSKILILPALSTALPLVSAEPFEARRWVRCVHHAFTARYNTARSFLKSSTSDQPKLVFVNGGSVSARVECIYRIAEQLTNGKIAEAEVIFNDIVKDGVVGILSQDAVEESNIAVEDHAYPKLNDTPKSHDFRGAIAMDAAKRLDYQAAEVQDMPMRKTFQEARNRKKQGVYSPLQDERYENFRGRHNEEGDYPAFSGDRIKQTIITIPSEVEDEDSALPFSKRSTFGILSATCYSPDEPESRTVNRGGLCDHDEEGKEDLLSNADKFEVPAGHVVFGHAQVIRVESDIPPRNMRSAKSVDRLNPSLKKDRRRSRSLTPKFISTHAIAHRAAALRGSRHGRRASLSDLGKIPHTPFVRASHTTIKKSGKSLVANSIKSPRRLYVDRGTDAHPACFPGEKIPSTPNTVESGNEISPFQPVFAVIEDLVIHFTDGADNSLLEAVVRSYKNWSYPPAPVSKSDFQSSQPSSPQPISSLTEDRLRYLSNWATETDGLGYPYNVGNAQSEQSHSWLPQRKGTRIENPVASTSAPLSPAATPPPTRLDIAHRFHRLSPINLKTATAIQNSLRAVLNVHFPPELTNYRQYSVPVEGDRLWKPVFRNSDGHFQEGTTVDQIIAIGAEDGISSNFFNEIAGKVERLGSKKNGMTRSGKLDMRFLIASAMQTFTKQSLSLQSQSSSSPFSSPMFLASLLVPQLEAYLASNVAVRLLVIHYSASHIPTILAIRHLVGTDTFKIAGILDSVIGGPVPLIHSVGNRLSNANVAAYNTRSRAPSKSASTRSIHTHSPSQSIEFKHNSSEPARISFSRANYLLPSTATDIEIASFLSNITNNLIEKSSYYIPEPTSLHSRRSSGGRNSPLSPTFSLTPSWRTTKSPTPVTSNSSRPMTPQTRDREHKATSRQSMNNNIIQSQPKLTDHATSLKPISMNHDDGNGATITTFSPPSTSQLYPSLSPTISLQNQPYPPPSNNTFTTTLHNNDNDHIITAHNKITSETINGRPATTTSRPNTATRDDDARERQSEREWANFYFEDSDYGDEFERILMPKVQRKIDRRKGNSKKALRWLGLA